MAIKYCASDKDVFIQILANYPVIEDKKTDAYNIEKKKKAWEKIAVEYNNSVTEKRTVLQLKRLWDKMKRSRKNALAEERREVMATGGGPSKPSPTPTPIDSLLPHLEYEIDIEDDSDGIILNRNAKVLHSTHDGPQKEAQATPTIPMAALLENSTKETPKTKGQSKSHLDHITGARLLLIQKEEQQLEELHQVRMEEAKYRKEEANYKKEAARFVMLQEEAKLKRILNE